MKNTSQADRFGQRVNAIRHKAMKLGDYASEIERELQKLLLDYNAEVLAAYKLLEKETTHDHDD